MTVKTLLAFIVLPFNVLLGQFYPPNYIKKVQKQLDSNEVIVEYITFIDELSVKVITKKTKFSISYTLPFSLDNTIDQLLTKFIKEEEKGFNRGQHYYTNAKALYQLLFSTKGEVNGVQTMEVASVEEVIQGKDLILLPKGKLAAIPLELLLLPTNDSIAAYENYTYLIDSHRVHYYPSLPTLEQNRLNCPKENRSKQEILLVGRHFPNLPTIDNDPIEQEIDSIHNLYPNAIVLKKQDARECTLIQLSDQYFKHIHIAAEGIFYKGNIEYSYFALNQGGFGGCDDTLHLYEIGQKVKLKGDLMVFAACESGVALTIANQKPVGLVSKLFDMDAACSIIVSLWKIDSIATQKFFEIYYHKLKKERLTKYDAMRQTQIEIRKQGYANPYYWTPFVFYGKPR